MSFLHFWRSRRGLAILAALVLLALFFVRPGVQKLRGRIVSEISLAVGRRVETSSVTFRLLPRPGFELENFVVHDDPTFGAEPMLRAADVTATLRLTSLLRGRLEIARLSLTEPSLNLVRDQQGRWNIEDLLERNDQIPAAPTSKPNTEARPGFPYIEASQGRINFKLGQEKTPYSLTDADFSLWQDSENSWGTRLKATPMRTDENVSDTGLLTVEGTWQRASSLRVTPLRFELQWDRAQLGQFTKLIRGNDAGWRGAVRLNATLSGAPQALKVTSSATIRDCRRFDVLSPGELRLAASCTATYSSADHSVSGLLCRAPVGTGAVSVSGGLSDLLGNRSYDLTVTAENVPLQSLVALALHAKKNIPGDLQAEGTADAHFTLRPEPGQSIERWEGGGTTSHFLLVSQSTGADLALGDVPFAFASDAQRKKSSKTTMIPITPETRLEIGPFRLALGRPTALNVEGWVSRAGYGFLLRGDAQPQQLQAAAQTVGVAAPKLTPVGAKTKNLQIAGSWAELKPTAGVKD